MSLRDLQSAVAMLIRLPHKNRGEEFPIFLAGYELTSHEKRQVEMLSEDRNVSKFGHSMANVRWEVVEKEIRMITGVLPDVLIEEIRRNHFEPANTKMRMGDYGLAFLEFCLKDNGVQRLLCEACPAYVQDVFRLELAQAKFRRAMRARRMPPEGSKLMHQAFQVVDLEHNIPAFLKGEPVEPKSMKLLITPGKDGTGYRYFEITAETHRFLLLEREREFHDVLPLIPETYSDLVEIGLCRPLH